MFTQEFDGYEWKPFYAMVGGGIPFEEVPAAPKGTAERDYLQGLWGLLMMFTLKTFRSAQSA